MSEPFRPARARRQTSPLAQRIRAKGWTIRDAARYLGVSRSRLYEVFRDPTRPRLWVCAISGLPRYGRHVAAELLAIPDPEAADAVRDTAPNDLEAKSTPMRAGNGTYDPGPSSDSDPNGGLAVGDIVIATRNYKAINEGDEGVIEGFESLRDERLILVATPNTSLRLTEDSFFDIFAETGRVRTEIEP